MKAEPLALATRVRVLPDADHGPGPWPGEPIGTIIASPVDGASYSWATTTSGVELQYWITFDYPQHDAENDGPYTSSQVLSRYLKPL